MILCSFVQNDEIIGNTNAISYETKKSGAWRSSCHMPDFFLFSSYFYQFSFKIFFTHFHTHGNIFPSTSQTYTFEQIPYKMQLRTRFTPDRQLLSRLRINAVKPTGEAGNHQASVSGRFPMLYSPIHRIIFLRVPGSQVSRPPSQKRRKPKIIRNAAT